MLQEDSIFNICNFGLRAKLKRLWIAGISLPNHSISLKRRNSCLEGMKEVKQANNLTLMNPYDSILFCGGTWILSTAQSTLLGNPGTGKSRKYRRQCRISFQKQSQDSALVKRCGFYFSLNSPSSNTWKISSEKLNMRS